jgi:hypothetical protein
MWFRVDLHRHDPVHRGMLDWRRVLRPGSHQPGGQLPGMQPERLHRELEQQAGEHHLWYAQPWKLGRMRRLQRNLRPDGHSVPLRHHLHLLERWSLRAQHRHRDAGVHPPHGRHHVCLTDLWQLDLVRRLQ